MDSAGHVQLSCSTAPATDRGQRHPYKMHKKSIFCLIAHYCDYLITCTWYYSLISGCAMQRVASLISFITPRRNCVLPRKYVTGHKVPRSLSICSSSNLTIHVYRIRTNNSDIKHFPYARARVPLPQPGSKYVARDRGIKSKYELRISLSDVKTEKKERKKKPGCNKTN